MPVRARSASSIAAIAVLAAAADVAQPVQLGVEAVADDAAVARERPAARRRSRARSRRARRSARRSRRQARTSGACRLERASAEARQKRQRLAERHEIARAGRAERDPRDQPLEIVHALQQLAQLRPRSVDRNAKSSTASSRSWMRASVTSGRNSQWRSSRPPMAVTVRSIVVEQRAGASAVGALDDVEVPERDGIDQKRIGGDRAARCRARASRSRLLRVAKIRDDRRRRRRPPPAAARDR